MTTARRRAVALFAAMGKQAAEYKLKRRGVGRRMAGGAGRGALGGALLGGGLALAEGLPRALQAPAGSRKEELKQLLRQVISGGLGGAMLGAPIGAAGETMLGQRSRLVRTDQ